MVKTWGAERGLKRFEGFTDAVFAIALTLLVVEIKPPGSPEGPRVGASLWQTIAEQWHEDLALLVSFVAIGSIGCSTIIPAGSTSRATTGSARSTSASCWR